MIPGGSISSGRIVEALGELPSAVGLPVAKKLAATHPDPEARHEALELLFERAAPAEASPQERAPPQPAPQKTAPPRTARHA